MDYTIIFTQQSKYLFPPSHMNLWFDNSQYKGHYYLTDTYTENYWLRYMIWILYLCFFTGCAMLITRIAPTAQGSGVPEMKAILSGT